MAPFASSAGLTKFIYHLVSGLFYLSAFGHADLFQSVCLDVCPFAFGHADLFQTVCLDVCRLAFIANPDVSNLSLTFLEIPWVWGNRVSCQGNPWV